MWGVGENGLAGEARPRLGGRTARGARRLRCRPVPAPPGYARAALGGASSGRGGGRARGGRGCAHPQPPRRRPGRRGIGSRPAGPPEPLRQPLGLAGLLEDEQRVRAPAQGTRQELSPPAVVPCTPRSRVCPAAQMRPEHRAVRPEQLCGEPRLAAGGAGRADGGTGRKIAQPQSDHRQSVTTAVRDNGSHRLQGAEAWFRRNEVCAWNGPAGGLRRSPP